MIEIASEKRMSQNMVMIDDDFDDVEKIMKSFAAI